MDDSCINCSDNSAFIVYDGGTVDGYYYACAECLPALTASADVTISKLETVYKVVCEVVPDVLADGIDEFSFAKKVAHAKAEEIWEEQGVSLYCVVKDSTGYAYFAVRYTPNNGGTYHVPIDYYLAAGA